MIFALLNPSTATAETDDPTICRCIEYARQWRYGGIIVVNLFAICSPDPKILKDRVDPVGPENKKYWDKAIHEARQGAEDMGDPGYKAPILCGWGVRGGYMGQDKTALDWLERKPVKLLALKVTKDNFPCHPHPRNGIPIDTKPIEYCGR